MSKVKVSKELADTLDFALIERGYTKSELLTTHVDKVHESAEWMSYSFQPFNKLTIAEFSDILFNDYEVENTPHDIIRANWNELCNIHNATSGNAKLSVSSMKQQTLFILDTLGEKVEGVNC